MEQETQIAASGCAEEPQEQQPEAVEEEEVQLVKRGRQPRLQLQPGAEEKLVLQFMGSLHSYLSLSHSLSSTLRQVKP